MIDCNNVKKNEKKYHNYNYDALRILCIYLVVVIHNNVIYLINNKGTIGWGVIKIFTSLSNVSVPLLFMLSGALLIKTDKVISIKELFVKRIKKQLIPFLIWSMIYLLLRNYLGKTPFTIKTIISLINEPAYYQFWFMYSLLGIYLLLPIFQIWGLFLDKQHQEYFLILIFLFSSLLPFISIYVPIVKISKHLDFVIFEGYILYFMLGYYLQKYHNKIKCNKYLIIGFFTVCFGTIFECIISKMNIRPQVYHFGDYMSPGMVVFSVGIFNIFLKYKINFINKYYIAYVSKICIGIFYSHMLFLMFLEKIGLHGSDNIIILMLKSFIIFFISLIFSYIISKFSLIKKILLGIY